MKTTATQCFVAVAMVAAVGLTACMAQEEKAEAKPAEASAADDEKNTLYAIGLAVSQQFQGLDLTANEFDEIAKGLKDGVLGNEPRVELMAYREKIQQFGQARAEMMTVKNKEEGEAFCAKAAVEEAGATRDASGMVFVPISDGSGAKPGPTDTVMLHYHGTLIDGTVFDSSVQKGEPATFPLNGVVPCFSSGVQKLAVGGKGKLICPSDTAYGDQGRPGIPPGATLIFEVELLDIVNKAQNSTP